MKNESRRSSQKNSGKKGNGGRSSGSGSSGGKGKGGNSKVGSSRVGADQSAAVDAKKLSKKKDHEVLYQVKTRRDAEILKAYITFTYRVYHPGVTVRLLFIGILIAAPALIAHQMWLRITCLAAGALLILLALFRQNISVAMTKKNDEDYKSGAEFTYEFTDFDASFYRNGEIFNYLSRYKDLMAFYYDEDHYYLATGNRDFLILPKKRFTIGDPKEFEDFIYRKSKKTCKWIPNNLRDQMKKRRAYRQLNAR